MKTFFYFGIIACFAVLASGCNSPAGSQRAKLEIDRGSLSEAALDRLGLLARALDPQLEPIVVLVENNGDIAGASGLQTSLGRIVANNLQRTPSLAGILSVVNPTEINSPVGSAESFAILGSTLIGRKSTILEEMGQLREQKAESKTEKVAIANRLKQLEILMNDVERQLIISFPIAAKDLGPGNTKNRYQLVVQVTTVDPEIATSNASFSVTPVATKNDGRNTIDGIGDFERENSTGRIVVEASFKRWGDHVLVPGASSKVEILIEKAGRQRRLHLMVNGTGLEYESRTGSQTNAQTLCADAATTATAAALARLLGIPASAVIGSETGKRELDWQRIYFDKTESKKLMRDFRTWAGALQLCANDATIDDASFVVTALKTAETNYEVTIDPGEGIQKSATGFKNWRIVQGLYINSTMGHPNPTVHRNLRYYEAVRKIAPKFNSEMSRTLECTVLVQITKDGSVSNAQVSESSGEVGFDNACLTAAKRWQFKPIKNDFLDGGRCLIPFSFNPGS